MDSSIYISSEFLSLFSNSLNIDPLSSSEDFSEFIISYLIDVAKTPSQEDYNQVIDNLNNRDNIHISIIKDDDVLGNFSDSNGSDFNSYVERLNNDGLSIGDQIKIVFTITKRKINNTISIYHYNEMINYLENLSFLTFLEVIEKQLSKEKLILENQDSSSAVPIFNTKTISFTNKDDDSQVEIINNTKREKRVNDSKSICHWDIKEKSLLPEDLHPQIKENVDKRLVQLFQKACLLYTTMFLFDYINVKNETFSYKLNGYKTFSNIIDTGKIKTILVAHETTELLYQIYQWCYIGGSSTDKIYISRNIISLNFEPVTLLLSGTTHDAILSNYKIYERKNVKQYIEVRNKLSEILIDLQSKIGEIVDGFTGDFKKNIITLISFFISVIAIQVVSKGDVIAGFTNEIIILSYAFLLISIAVLIYSRWEITRKISIYEKHYMQLKDRYKELLSQEELENIFEQCDPKKDKSNIDFVTKQKKYYSVVWMVSIIILGLSLLLIYLINNSDSINCINHN